MTYLSEKFCLKWNDFQQNIVGNYQELRNHPDFSDVTLVCEEDQQIEAHKIILTASSPIFRSLLKKNKHSHPMIYMKGLKTKDLVAILDFIYNGEANIHQEDLDEFLALAEELQLKGLAGAEKGEEVLKKNIPEPKNLQTLILKTENHPLGLFKPVSLLENTTSLENALVPVTKERSVVSVNSEIESLEEKIDSMIEEVNDGINNRRCNVCGKTTKCGTPKRAMTRHVETHIEGVSHTCNQCGKVARSSNALTTHISSYHRK